MEVSLKGTSFKTTLPFPSNKISTNSTLKFTCLQPLQADSRNISSLPNQISHDSGLNLSLKTHSMAPLSYQWMRRCNVEIVVRWMHSRPGLASVSQPYKPYRFAAKKNWNYGQRMVYNALRHQVRDFNLQTWSGAFNLIPAIITTMQ